MRKQFIRIPLVLTSSQKVILIETLILPLQCWENSNVLRTYHQKQEQTWDQVSQELITTCKSYRSVIRTLSLTWTTLRILERSTSAMMPIFVIKAFRFKQFLKGSSTDYTNSLLSLSEFSVTLSSRFWLSSRAWTLPNQVRWWGGEEIVWSGGSEGSGVFKYHSSALANQISRSFFFFFFFFLAWERTFDCRSAI